MVSEAYNMTRAIDSFNESHVNHIEVCIICKQTNIAFRYNLVRLIFLCKQLFLWQYKAILITVRSKVSLTGLFLSYSC